MHSRIKKIVKQLVQETLDEISAISGGAATTQSGEQISGTGGNPLGRDMSDQYKTMWSGDEPDKNKEVRKLKEEFIDEDDLDEINISSGGAVVGYTLPLGTSPEYDAADSNKKNKRPRRWYDVVREEGNNINKLSEQPLPPGFTGFDDVEVHDSQEISEQQRILMALDRGDKFTIGPRKPIYRVIGPEGEYKGALTKLVVIDGTAERKAYMIKVVDLNSYDVGAFELTDGGANTLSRPRGKPGRIIVSKKIDEDVETSYDEGHEEDMISPPFPYYDGIDDDGESREYSVFAFEQLFTTGEKTTIKLDNPNLFATQDEIDLNTIKKQSTGEWQVTGTPVVVQAPDGKQYIQDGHHRLSAMKINGEKKAQVYLIKLPDNYFYESSEKTYTEELIDKNGGLSYFQMGSSLPDKLYNKTNNGIPTRDPGIVGKKYKKLSETTDQIKDEDVELVSLDLLWEKNKDSGWESDLTPEDIANAFIHDDDYIWLQASEDELAQNDIDSVSFWIGRLQEYPGAEENIPHRWNIFVDGTGEIVDGYHRMTAAHIVGLKRFPVVGFIKEGVVPQGSANKRQLHGAPIYFHPTGRSLPDKLSDRSNLNSKANKKKKKTSPGPRVWYSHEGLLDTKKLEKKQKKKKKWYQKETTNEMDQKSFQLHLEEFRQNSSWSPRADKKLSRKKSFRGTKQKVKFLITENIIQHLQDRGVDIKKTRVITDVESDIAVFLLYNLSGKLVGYQQYNPSAPKESDKPSEQKYFTYVSKYADKTIAVWGLETVKDEPYLFVVEGVFDVIKLHNAGLPAIAVLGNNPKFIKPWLMAMNKHVIVIADNDKAGSRLKRIGNRAIVVPEPYGDLGDMPQKEVLPWIQQELGFVKESICSLASLFTEDTERSTVFYHGTNQEFGPGDLLEPPSTTGNVSEKGRKKNLNKIFVTLDKGSAKIYAGRATQSNGGSPYIYQVEPLGDIEWLNRTTGTTVLMADSAKIIRRIQ